MKGLHTAEFDTGGFEMIRPLPAMHEFLISFNFSDSNLIHHHLSSHSNITKESVTITGNFSQYFGYLTFTGRFRIFSIQFRPNGFFGIFGTPAHLFTNTAIMGHAFLKNDLSVLHNKLYECISVKEMAFHSEQFLISFLNKRKSGDYKLRIEYVANSILKTPYISSVEGMASIACMSLKTFERNFTEQVGVNPKMYARLVRFTKAMNLKVISDKHTWTSIAHTCGYYDQMHLVKEFKLFTEKSPTEFFKQSPPPTELITSV